jgi:predicted oxidoreductase
MTVGLREDKEPLPMRSLPLIAIVLTLGATSCSPPSPRPEWDADLVIVGAGIAGLSAAVEVARSGGDVLVVDMASVFGGHAVSAHGGLAIVGSPVQEAAGVADDAELAYGDFMEWGGDADETWVRYYVDHSKTEIHDWLVDLGVEFEGLWHVAGNSVPRFHNVRGRGLGLVTPIYLGAVSHGVRFQWNVRVDELIREDGRVGGVRGIDLRGDTVVTARAPAVLLATGGFQSNIERVEANWDASASFPDRILAGSGWNSQGLGLDLARAAGARFHRLDHQWNYVTGIPDPRYPEDDRGLNLLSETALWVNVDGQRFVDECASAKHAMPALLAQPTGTYWTILDARSREEVVVSGSGWTEDRVEQLIFGNTDLVKTASTIAGLARAAGIPEQALVETHQRFNAAVGRGVDDDFGRFGQVDDGLPCREVRTLSAPPYYAIRMYPLARKSMGGIEIDGQSRVVSLEGGVVPGLFAAGEVAGFGGINGRAGLEGTFLGPSIVTGRVAGRSVLAELRASGMVGEAPAPRTRPELAPRALAEYDNASCTECHDLGMLVDAGRPGYWHFELSHRAILDAGRQCSQCHGELAPYDEGSHRVDPLRRAQSCDVCHGLQAID